MSRRRRHLFFWQTILKNRSKYRGDISEQSVVCTVLISAIIIEIFRKNIPISYIIPYKKLASPLIPVCLKKSHMLGIRPVWSESSLSAWRKLGSLATHWAHSGDSDQTGRMPRLIWVFAGRTLTLLVLSRGGSYLHCFSGSRDWLQFQFLPDSNTTYQILLYLWHDCLQVGYIRPFLFKNRCFFT